MDVDANTLETPFDDIGALPPDVVSPSPTALLRGETPNPAHLPPLLSHHHTSLQVSLLRLRLRKAALSPGEGVSRLFLHAQALLFGGYRDALVCSPVSYSCRAG